MSELSPFTLFEEPPALRYPPPGSHRFTIQETFEAFHRLNPWVYAGLVSLAHDAVAHGARKIGIGMLFEVLRWHYYRATVDPWSDFKLNNNYRSRYARLIMQREPELEGKFEIRELKSA